MDRSPDQAIHVMNYGCRGRKTESRLLVTSLCARDCVFVRAFPLKVLSMSCHLIIILICLLYPKHVDFEVLSSQYSSLIILRCTYEDSQ